MRQHLSFKNNHQRKNNSGYIFVFDEKASMAGIVGKINISKRSRLIHGVNFLLFAEILFMFFLAVFLNLFVFQQFAINIFMSIFADVSHILLHFVVLKVQKLLNYLLFIYELYWHQIFVFYFIDWL